MATRLDILKAMIQLLKEEDQEVLFDKLDKEADQEEKEQEDF